VPDLISDEAVSETQSAVAQGMVPGCRGIACLAVGRSSRNDRNFNYLILTHPVQDGGMVLREYRTNENGKPIDPGMGAPSFRGFISAWLVFSSLNQVESRFRFLGQQRIEGHSTFVVGLAQIPGSVESPGVILIDGESIPMLLQGITWGRPIGFQHRSAAHRPISAPARDFDPKADGLYPVWSGTYSDA